MRHSFVAGNIGSIFRISFNANDAFASGVNTHLIAPSAGDAGAIRYVS